MYASSLWNTTLEGAYFLSPRFPYEQLNFAAYISVRYMYIIIYINVHNETDPIIGLILIDKGNCLNAIRVVFSTVDVMNNFC